MKSTILLSGILLLGLASCSGSDEPTETEVLLKQEIEANDSLATELENKKVELQESKENLEQLLNEIE